MKGKKKLILFLEIIISILGVSFTTSAQVEAYSFPGRMTGGVGSYGNAIKYYWAEIKMNNYKYYNNASFSMIGGIGDVRECISSHEFGHAIGLAHTPNKNAGSTGKVMRQDFPRAFAPAQVELQEVARMYP
ncbi:hypothetical protein CYV26_03595 [Carnobacterium maltaromaticum]|uniref:hypothetical protein n=1 Tax=Carnobacterium maltaromaticum TaxID=2751 RepID=UPI000C7671CB|nr:hypothetical protein [Carnobacterium maltaromaticum]PLS39302.1 hypothetical protein CYV33_01060 [Carnobacterium maltaromaticum]PLS40111.1 hypothetical protein CYV30_01055 [Carnobacterium maltaromaticum]PLS40448.1 hypothetical protein CYV31_01055 [Carnobacterium maltaromaticum]PLS46091.1 hypothetical protein CYV28_01055 [Carnobacterium maltaromaticum]PLS47243.1 hypothetical protein CYV27_03065 [Carnobacterium maltaromaticum]